MKYRKDKYGNKISALGYGCMRFTQKAGKIDIDKAYKEIMAAYEAGVNYYDTAFIYSGSEAALGEIFQRAGIRNKINIATKLPHYLIKSKEGCEKMFQEQLKRLKTDYVDYYLMHMLTDVKSWERLKSIGILDWIREKQASGQIKQIGFSYHGNSGMFCQLIDAFDWDFCQIQYNYLDENFQAGRKGLQYAAARGIPVIIMEPLRGGKLVNNLPAEAVKLFAEHPVPRTPAEWSFRWLWNQPEVTCVLSGMNSVDMVKENCTVADSAEIGDLGPAEEALLSGVAAAINGKMKVGCTGCGYCMPCPKNVDIPGTFSAYNRRYSEGKIAAMREYMMGTILRKDVASIANCIGCGKCESHCPQHIEIRKELTAAKKELEGPVYKVAKKVIPLVMKY
ncbi:MAG: aldo/keto reductase [Firmicutes bacterium]|nr:aldo/keto reductase [Bacillota bacterium]